MEIITHILNSLELIENRARNESSQEILDKEVDAMKAILRNKKYVNCFVNQVLRVLEFNRQINILIIFKTLQQTQVKNTYRKEAIHGQ